VRKQERIIVWPAYFDSTRTRNDGRRVAKNLAVASPRVAELKEAAERLGLSSEVVADAGYSKNPWQKTGMILTEKNGSKGRTISLLARELMKARSTVQPMKTSSSSPQ